MKERILNEEIKKFLETFAEIKGETVKNKEAWEKAEFWGGAVVCFDTRNLEKLWPDIQKYGYMRADNLGTMEIGFLVYNEKAPERSYHLIFPIDVIRHIVATGKDDYIKSPLQRPLYFKKRREIVEDHRRVEREND